MFYNILHDAKFENGFKLKGLNSLKDGHFCRKMIENNGKVPEWFLCQWNSRYDFCTDGVIEKLDKGYKFYDGSKSITVDKNGAILMTLDASKEFSAPRKPDEPWPHLLLEQDIEPYVKLDDIKSLKMQGTFELKDFCDFMGGNAEEYHTTQFVWVTVIKNVNEKSPDFGHFIWVVLNISDSRYEITPFYCAQDKALPNGEFIYSFGSSAFFSGKLEKNCPKTIDFDVYPKLNEILSCAQKAHYLPDTRIQELAITGMNFGFEITGTYSASILVKDIAIQIEKNINK